jgi:Flp pilus assembly protein TadD
MKTSQTRLDVDELLHLAIRASQQNQHEQTINYLKQALELAPDNGKVHYMLGAEHAEIGLYDRAVEDMTNAVKLDPGLTTAHFQLGLLHITSGRVDEAIKAWKPLDALGKENPLYLFKSGMIHLARDEFDACVQSLTRGIALNTFNEALNKDMQRIIDEVKARGGQQAAKSTAVPTAKPQKPSGSHVLLSAYRNNKEEKE